MGPRPDRPDGEQAIATNHGPHPFVTDIEAVTLGNNAFRSTLWTGKHLQLCVTAYSRGDRSRVRDIDQFIRVEGGAGVVAGPTREDLSLHRDIADDDVVLIPAGSWHNVVNTGDEPLYLFRVHRPTRAPAARSTSRRRGRRRRPATPPPTARISHEI